jgi:exodeoxyribonuclease VII large subunit
MRGRLIAALGRLDAAAARRRERARTQVQHAAARLDALSPLSVLGRDYAVAWNADKTGVLRDSAGVAAGDIVHVTLARGELTCEVRKTTT